MALRPNAPAPKCRRPSLESWTEQKKHDSNFGSFAREKVGLFQNQERFHCFCNRQGGLTTGPLSCIRDWGHLRNLATGEHKNVAAVASC